MNCFVGGWNAICKRTIPALSILLIATGVVAQPAPSAGLHGETTPYHKFLGPWRVIGPLDPGETNQARRMEQAYLGLEDGEAMPDSVTSGTEVFEAKTVAPGLVNLGWAFDPAREYKHTVAYAETVILSPDEREVLLTLGGDDGVVAWLNGEKVLDHVRPNGVYADDKISTVTLKAGSNRLLVKCDNIGEDWGFAARILPVDAGHSLKLNYHIDPLPLALTNLPEARVELLDADGSVLEKQEISGWKVRETPFRAGYMVRSEGSEPPAQISIEIDVPGAEPFKATYDWNEADGKTVGKPGSATIRGNVVSAETGAALTGATVAVGDTGTTHAQANSDGAFTLSGFDPAYGRIYVNAPGHLESDTQFDWRSDEPLTIALKPGGAGLTGIIRDEDGNPIEGAEITIRSGRSRKAVTDASGRYTFSGLVASSRSSVYPVVMHPDFEALGSFSIDIESTGTTTKDLLMTKGMVVTGKVTGEDGSPIRGVKVISGKDDFASNSANPSTMTEADGTYRLGGLPMGVANVFAFHDDYAPEMIAVRPGDEEGIDFVLKPGKSVRGTVVDKHGKPIENVGLGTDTWRGARMFRRSTRTDADGKFELKHMPDDVVETDFYHRTYSSNRDVKLQGGDTNVSVTLQMPTKVEGRVVDAKTGEPVTAFSLIEGIRWESSAQDHWQGPKAIESSEGKFSLTETELSRYKRLLRVEAPGYKTWEYPDAIAAGEEVEIEAKLEKDELRPAAVVDQNGQPVAGATVHIFGDGRTLWLGHSRAQSKAKTFTADENGKVELPSSLSKSDGIYAEKEGVGAILQESADVSGDPLTIKLQPFGSLGGALFEGETPKAGAEIVLLRGSNQQLQGQFKATTNQNGLYHFEDIPAGEYSLAVYKKSGSFGSYANSTKIDIHPGENPPRLIGGSGGTRVYGTVLTESGDPIADLMISLRNETGFSATAYTDANGKYEMPDVPKGSMSLNAYTIRRTTGDDSYHHNENLEIPEAESFEKNMELITRKAIEPGLVIKNIHGADPDGTTVSLTDLGQDRVLLLQPLAITAPETKDLLTTVSREAAQLKESGIAVLGLAFSGGETTATKTMAEQFPAIKLLVPDREWIMDYYKRYRLEGDAVGVLLKSDGEVTRVVADEAELKTLGREED